MIGCLQELKANQQEELGLAEKGEEDMDMSDNEDEKPKTKKEVAKQEVITIDDEPETKRIKLMAAESKCDVCSFRFSVNWFILFNPVTYIQNKQINSREFYVPPILFVLLDELMTLKEENQSMQCQIEAYKNETEIMKGERDKYSEEKETQIKALQHALVGMQQVCVNGVPQGSIFGLVWKYAM